MPNQTRVAASPRRIRWSIILIAAIFVVSGVLHFLIPLPYERIVPPWLPNAALLVQLSGLAELIGALGLLWPPTRRAAGWGLILLLIAVFPANVEMLRQARASGASLAWQGTLWLRLPLQVVMIWWIWRSAARRSFTTPTHGTVAPAA
ncbi:MAG: hypothetical protein ABI877_16065 [Gemmatimonadaceae bacterium]